MILALAPLHLHEASCTEFIKPAGVKRKRHHTFQKGYSWGGYNGVLHAAMACRAADLLERCTLLSDPLTVMLGVYRAPVLVGGRYLKLSRSVPQSPWFEDVTGERIGVSSVQVRAHTGRARTSVIFAPAVIATLCGRSAVLSSLLACGISLPSFNYIPGFFQHRTWPYLL